MQVGIILCGSVRSRSMIETRVRTKVKAMLAINEAPKDFDFGILWRYGLGQELGTGEKILGHDQTEIEIELRYFSLETKVATVVYIEEENHTEMEIPHAPCASRVDISTFSPNFEFSGT